MENQPLDFFEEEVEKIPFKKIFKKEFKLYYQYNSIIAILPILLHIITNLELGLFVLALGASFAFIMLVIFYLLSLFESEVLLQVYRVLSIFFTVGCSIMAIVVVF